ncbi:Myb-like DNA-binding domain containing protein [Tritrichomonas foetus]|uniref:Myb-like DNA-binding domain containing protein n=1 Tax=Tritrichomonas foetus TaxID=1144522 RepID=A0A1J4KJQ5_9EUKA|nr:Myb-like DNA-binding domain containing protein [Tritrichomonas foetus]|eukprot:OHT10060.1 Myb-like DNA-binding domain containing protein [Tritrichomonas foetus]
MKRMFEPKHHKFSYKEDQLLLHYVNTMGTNNWKAIAQLMEDRTARQCRERFKYYLDPQLNKVVSWTPEEDKLLLSKYEEVGPKWAFISYFFTGRTDIDLKNRYNRLMRIEKRNCHQTTTTSPSASNSNSDSDHETQKTKKRMILFLPEPISRLLEGIEKRGIVVE